MNVRHTKIVGLVFAGLLSSGLVANEFARKVLGGSIYCIDRALPEDSLLRKQHNTEEDDYWMGKRYPIEKGDSYKYIEDTLRGKYIADGSLHPGYLNERLVRSVKKLLPNQSDAVVAREVNFVFEGTQAVILQRFVDQMKRLEDQRRRLEVEEQSRQSCGQ